MRSVRATRRARLLAAAVVVAALVLTASACGGSSSSDTTTTNGASATLAWASAVCTSFSSWKASLQRDKASLGSQPTATAFQNASHQAVLATQGLQSSLQQLGPPPTAASASAKSTIDTLKSQLQSGRNKINQTLNGSQSSAAELKSSVSSVKATALSMQQDFTAALTSLKSLDPGSELEKAFHQATACKPYFT